jgi:hypothetical protein
MIPFMEKYRNTAEVFAASTLFKFVIWEQLQAYSKSFTESSEIMVSNFK